MGRWEPGARGRLASAALSLYADQGFDRTTVAEIAHAAGLSESSFFRHFVDKREVLFAGFDAAADLLTSTIANTPGERSPWDTVVFAIESLCDFIAQEPSAARQRISVVSTDPNLRERDLTKHAELAASVTHALVARGVAPLTAGVLAETSLAAYKVTTAAWVEGPPSASFSQIFRSATEELTIAISNRSESDGDARPDADRASSRALERPISTT